MVAVGVSALKGICEGPPVLLEAWRVVDRWWTDEPDVREYRELQYPDARRVVEWRRPGEPWGEIADSASRPP